MRTPSPSWCGLDRTHLWPTGSSLGDPLITARNFFSCPSDSISRWTPCPPETPSGGCRSALAVSYFRLRARLDFSIPSTSPHALRIPSRDGHPALRRPQVVASGPPWLYPTFVFVPVSTSPYLPLIRPARLSTPLLEDRQS